MDVQVKVRGMRTLERRMKRLPGKVRDKALKRSVRLGANVVRKAAREEAPRGRTGKLRPAISVRKAKTESRWIATDRVTVTKKAFYWRFVEFGTVKQRANPFMQRGFEKSKFEAERRIRKTLADSIRQHTK